MTERPILFNGPMVRAILDGRKTVTRRPAVDDRAPCAVGDLLWVRETHVIVDGRPWEDLPCRPGPEGRWAYYRAGFDRVPPRWRPSIHMPRWASRLTLRVVDVRLDSVQAIDDADAVREGFTDRGAFLAAWQAIYGGADRRCWRIAFAVEASP